MATTYAGACRMDMGAMAVDWQERIDFERLRADRQRKVRDALAKHNVDVLLCWRYENYRYLTSARNHEWPTFQPTWAAGIAREGDPFFWDMDRETIVANMPWVNGDDIIGELRIAETDGVAELWCREVREACNKRKVKPKRIAIDVLTVPMMKALAKELPEAELVNGQQVVIEARMLKTPDEVRCLLMAYQITAAGMETARSLLRVPNMTESALLGEAYRVMYGHGSEWTQCTNIVCSGGSTYPYRRLTTDKIIHPGDAVIVDIGGRFNGYYGDFTRCFIAGEDARATRTQQDLYRKNYDALCRAQEALKIGNTTADVYKAVGEDCVWGGVLGHGIGIGPTELPKINRRSLVEPTALEPGMVFSIEPYTTDNRSDGIRLENNYVITETGATVLGPFPHDPKLLAAC
ncbi:MAG: aminopeptidase P family protein [Betaproteobacteria bacterium]|nr:aminopeptidase P family protein [Betaproteobacteria bacterium]